jgi:hypothetical protein
VTERRTKTDFRAHQIKELVDERYSEAKKIVLVIGNLNTHTLLLPSTKPLCLLTAGCDDVASGNIEA